MTDSTIPLHETSFGGILYLPTHWHANGAPKPGMDGFFGFSCRTTPFLCATQAPDAGQQKRPRVGATKFDTILCCRLAADDLAKAADFSADITPCLEEWPPISAQGLTQPVVYARHLGNTRAAVDQSAASLTHPAAPFPLRRRLESPLRSGIHARSPSADHSAHCRTAPPPSTRNAPLPAPCRTASCAATGALSKTRTCLGPHCAMSQRATADMRLMPSAAPAQLSNTRATGFP